MFTDQFLSMIVNKRCWAWASLMGQGARLPLDLLSGQIAFPATQKPSSNANTLDDYKAEGTWTPAIRFNSAVTGITYSVQIGTYMKIGRYVHAPFSIQLSSKGSATGVCTLAGFPAACSNANDFAGVIGYWSSMTSSFVYVGVYLQGGTTVAGLLGATGAATGLTQLHDTDFSNTTVLKGAISYNV